MALISVIATCEDTLGAIPSLLLVNTSDTSAVVQNTGYLNGAPISPSGFLSTPPAFLNGQIVIVKTTDMNAIFMRVSIDGSSNVNLVPYGGISSRTFTTPTFSNVTTANQLSAVKDALVNYSFSATVTISVLTGQSVTANLKYADNSGMSTNVVTLDSCTTSNSGVLGLTQTNSLKLSGIIPAGKYRQVTFAVTGSATAPNALTGGQEVML